MADDRALKILLLAHDLSDAAIERRVLMLREGGGDVAVAGFRRTPEPILQVGGAPTINFGRTYAAGFLHRVWSTLREILFLNQYRRIFTNADIIIARNLEMLAIAVRGQSLCCPAPVIVYECLDIHRLLLGSGLIGITLRTLEGWLARHASALFTSSPAFISNYFSSLSKVRLPIKLIENKVLQTDQSLPSEIPPTREPGPPWIIGWFGIIRCQKSLHILSELVRRSKGKVAVVIRGRAAVHEFDDFYKQIDAVPGIRFLGPYKSPDDLAAMYTQVHFTWAIDLFEEGLNSSWLLPNRLYEGGLYGSIPLALKGVETGRFIDNLGIGVSVPEPYIDYLCSFFNDLQKSDYTARKYSVEKLPKTAWVYDKEYCTALVQYLYSLSDKRGFVSGGH